MKVDITSTGIHSAAFWAELGRSEYLVQCWHHEDALLDALEGYVGAGLRGGECVVVACTAPHLHDLEKRLRTRWLDVDRARWERRYVPLLAQETLALILDEEGMPDAEKFERTMGRIVQRAGDRKVRMFGELVNVLWSQGRVAATWELQKLWARFVAARNIPLLCAYDARLFPPGSKDLERICNQYTRVLPG